MAILKALIIIIFCLYTEREIDTQDKEARNVGQRVSYLGRTSNK